MYFDSLHALLDMDGHGVYVWTAYAVAVLVIAWLMVAPFRRRWRLMSAIRAGQRREAAAAERRLAQSTDGGVSTEKESVNAPSA